MKIDKIAEANYQGYYWLSDANTPCVLNGEAPFHHDLNPEANPFIIEAQLYDPVNRVSYSVKYIDGKYVAHRWDNVDRDMADGENYILHKYYPNRLEKEEQAIMLHFIQHWVAERDPACAGDMDNPDSGMSVLQPKELIFVGF